VPSPEPALRVEPWDEFNRTLVGNVHPADWVNPEPKSRYHLVVIGAGAAGLTTAAIAAGLGARVALVERHLMGGDCLNVGCVPSKALIAAARSWQAAADSSRCFGGPRATGSGDFGEVMARMRKLRAGISQVDAASRYRALGVDVFLGRGCFTAPDTITVDGKLLRFRRSVIATGARAATGQIPGLEAAGYLTNETVFSLTELPRHLLVIGGGPAGCEMAQAFARFGANVTVLSQHSRILIRDDADAALIVERAMERHGVRLERGAKVTRAESRDGRKILQFEREGVLEEVAGDRILAAVGRTPELDGLSLEAAGVRHDRRGVVVDDRLRTSNRRIFAVGDACSPHQFTHIAEAEARLAVANALFFGVGGGTVGRLAIPWTTYTTPEVAHVGLSADEALQRGQKIGTLTVPLTEVDRAVLEGQEEGFLRLHFQAGTDRVLGATLVAEHAGELIGEIALAITAGIGLSTLSRTIHPYPTQAEVFRRAADAWRRTGLTPGFKRLLSRYFRLFN
jgi:pyruvate/2-oxoglutarate dehydrogenase complex dihydrolipoamide dehydrogenase (E3) component